MPRRSAFERASPSAAAQVSLAQISMSDARSASVTATLRPRADVGVARGAAAQPFECRVDQSLRRCAKREHPTGIGLPKVRPWKRVVYTFTSYTTYVPDWTSQLEREQARYEDGSARLQPGDERQLVRLGNAAYGAGLASLMTGAADAPVWFARAAARWRESWELAPPDAWGRPIGAVKAAVLAGDEAAVEELARWSLEQGAAVAESPIGRYAGCVALLALGRWPEARHVAESLRARDDFPPHVADALATIAAHDIVGAIEAIEGVVGSFETRTDYLEDVPVADTALVLAALAERRGIAVELPASLVLPNRSDPCQIGV